MIVCDGQLLLFHAEESRLYCVSLMALEACFASPTERPVFLVVTIDDTLVV